MAKLAKPKAKDKPAAPKKPSTRSKTGNAACSEAASNWQLSLRGKAALSPDTYQTLAKCRAMNRTAKMAEAQGRTGKLSTMGEQAVKARLQSRFDSGLITQKARTEKLEMLLKQRSQRGKVAPKAETPVAAKPASTAENKGTYGDYYFTPDGKYVSMSGSGGIGSNRVGARDINGKMIGWYDRKELRFANEKQRPTKESEIASERLSAISKEVSDLREKNARLLIGRDTTDKLRRELSQGKITKEKYGELVQKGYALSDKDYAKSGEVQKQIESVKSRLVQRGTEGSSGGEMIPPKPAQPARYSLGGKLAPGRGTEKRKNRVSLKIYERSERNAQRAYAAGAIPLSDKKRIGADENFVATIFQSETGGPGRQRFAKAVKTVSGADRAAVQIESVKEGGKYGVIDPVSGFGAGLNYKKQADAKSVAIRMDRLTKRASREQGGGILSLNDVASGKGGSRYQELLKSVVRRELRRSGQSGRASRIR